MNEYIKLIKETNIFGCFAMLKGRKINKMKRGKNRKYNNEKNTKYIDR